MSADRNRCVRVAHFGAPVRGRGFDAPEVLLDHTQQIDRHSGSPLRLGRMTALPSRSAFLSIVAALALCAAARADDAAPPAPSGDERRLIGDYIRNQTREIRDCYEKRLQERKTLQGKLLARFDIGPSGQVIGASAEGMGDRELSVCVVKVVRGWEFDKPQSGGKLRVGYPWVFTPTPGQ